MKIRILWALLCRCQDRIVEFQEFTIFPMELDQFNEISEILMGQLPKQRRVVIKQARHQLHLPQVKIFIIEHRLHYPLVNSALVIFRHHRHHVKRRSNHLDNLACDLNFQLVLRVIAHWSITSNSRIYIPSWRLNKGFHIRIQNTERLVDQLGYHGVPSDMLENRLLCD